MKLKPVNNYLIIEMVNEEIEVSKGGLILGESALSRKDTGRVVAVSEGSSYEVGQEVMYMKNSGTSFKEDPLAKEDTHKIIKEEFILGIWQS